MDAARYITRNEFVELESKLREQKAIIDTRLNHAEKMIDRIDGDMRKMNETLTRIDERQAQMQTETRLHLKQQNDTMTKQFRQLAAAIDRIVDHLISGSKDSS